MSSPITWMYCRDQIVVNSALLERIQGAISSEELASGGTLALVARDIRHEAGYSLRLRGYHLILVADRYDGAGGSVELSGVSGEKGGDGGPGKDGRSDTGGDSWPGEPGGPGDDGTPGTSAMNVTLCCRELHRTHLIANGGTGGGAARAVAVAVAQTAGCLGSGPQEPIRAPAATVGPAAPGPPGAMPRA